MKVAKLLEIHNSHQGSDSESKNFGDGYLVKNNRIYRNIRSLAIKEGYHFTDKINPKYQAFPFGELESILSSKLIPFADNVTILQELNKKLNGDFYWDEVIDGFKKNYLFHESCHAVVRSHPQSSHLQSVSDQHKCIQILLEESFANTCELLAVVDVKDNAHKIFFEANSYTHLLEAQSHLEKLILDTSFTFVLRFTWLAYLHSNFLRENLQAREFDRVLQFASTNEKANLSASSMKTLKALAKTTFTLDLRFRTITTRLHLKLAQLKNLDTLFSFDFMKVLESEAAYSKLMRDLGKNVVED